MLSATRLLALCCCRCWHFAAAGAGTVNKHYPDSVHESTVFMKMHFSSSGGHCIAIWFAQIVIAMTADLVMAGATY